MDSILENKRFPAQPDGKIELGSIDQAETGDVRLQCRRDDDWFYCAASFNTGLGVFDAAADAVNSSRWRMLHNSRSVFPEPLAIST